MPRARLQPGNPEWIAILEQRREAILEKDPTANWAHSLSRAIGELKRTEDSLDFPGQRQIKFIGPKIIELLNKELAKGPIRSDETYPSSDRAGPLDFPGVHGFDPQAFSFHHKKTKTHTKSKAPAPLKASASLPNLSIAAPPHPPVIDQARCVEVYRPKEGSGEAALLIGLYSQCNATRQRVAVETNLLLLCGEAYATGSPPNGQDLAALVKAECLEEGSYTLTWRGFRSAERCAIKRGIPRIQITVDDFAQPGTVVSAQQSQAASATSVANVPRQQMQTVVRPQTLIANDSCIPRKRKTSAMCDAYSDLGMPAVGGQGQALPAAQFLPKAAPRKVATGAFARSYIEAPVKIAAPVADALPFSFAYLDNRDNRVSNRDQADVKIQDISGVTLFRVEFRSKQARHPIARTIKDAVPLASTPAEADGATEAGWLIADKAPPTCSGLHTSAAIKKPKQTARLDLMAGLKEKPKEDPRAMYRFPPASTLGMGSSSSSPEKSSLRLPIAQSTSLRRTVSDSAAPPPALFTYEQPVASTSGWTRPLPTVQRVAKPYIAPSADSTVAPAPPVVKIAPVQKPRDTLPALKRSITSSFPLGTAAETDFPAFNPIVLQPNDYDVVLLVDHREVKGVTSIETTLFSAGVPFEVVNLELGDYLWVARRRTRLGDNYDGVVLAICERKRKDDFMTSIKNERYCDQKQRIRLTGIRKCFYLTEHHDLEYETFIKAIQTSMSQTQVIDDFTLLVALSPAETIAHLRRITTGLQQATKPLLVIPDDLVKPNTISLLQKDLGQKQPQADYYTTWSSFERINRKLFTLHSVWAKMASCMNGVSQEVCVDLLEHYPSPLAFLAGIEGRLAGEEQAGRLADRNQVAAKRKKLKGDDVGLHVKNVLDRGYRPRPLNGPASQGIWNLFTSWQYE